MSVSKIIIIMITIITSIVLLRLFLIYLTPPGGDVLSWGSNSYGQLGLGKEIPSQEQPKLVAGLTGVAVSQISAGATHTMFLTLPGLVYCCGANKSGQLGLNRVDEKGTDSRLLTFIKPPNMQETDGILVETCLDHKLGFAA